MIYPSAPIPLVPILSPTTPNSQPRRRLWLTGGPLAGSGLWVPLAGFGLLGATGWYWFTRCHWTSCLLEYRCRLSRQRLIFPCSMARNGREQAASSKQHSYLQDPFVIYLVEDRPVDLVGFEGDPVEHRHAELGLDRLLDFHS